MKTNRILLLAIIIIAGISLISLTPKEEQTKPKKAKYIFLFIGDGMGINHTMITNKYLELHKQNPLSFLSFENVALTITTPIEPEKITDSAAAGTAIACSEKTKNGVLGMNVETGEKFESIAETAKKSGMKVGIISSVGLNHATPAAFYAKREKRSMYNEIALDMANSNFDYFGGGGIIAGNNEAMLAAVNNMRQKGYQIIDERTKYSKENKYSDKVYYSVFNELEEAAIPYKIDRNENMAQLADFVRFGIPYLDNEKGFFIMAEGGKIDWSSHGNDGATTIHEVIDFDIAIREALKFYEKHPDETLIIVTADHETGGISFGSDEKGYTTDFRSIDQQKASEGAVVNSIEDMFVDVNKTMNNNFGLELTKNYMKKYTASELADKMIDSLNRAAGISWTTHAHTGTTVATFAIGVGSEQFTGLIDNTDISKYIKKAAKLN